VALRQYVLRAEGNRAASKMVFLQGPFSIMMCVACDASVTCLVPTFCVREHARHGLLDAGVSSAKYKESGDAAWG
jgi:hypothetical protein